MCTFSSPISYNYYGTSWENLFKHQEISSLLIISFIPIRERSLIIGGGGPVNLGGGPGVFGLPFGEGHMFLGLC